MSKNKKQKTINRIDKVIIPKKKGDYHFKKITEEVNNIYNFINFNLRQMNIYLRSKSDEDLHENTLKTVNRINEEIVKFNSQNEKNNIEPIIRGKYMPNMTQKYAKFLNYLIRERDAKDFPDGKNPFKEIQAGIAQSAVLDLVMEDWKNFMKSIAAYSKDPSKFKRLPRQPNFKKKGGQSHFYVFNNAFTNIRNKEGWVRVAPNSTNRFEFKKSRPNDKLTQLRILPRKNHYVLEQVYQYPLDEKTQEKLQSNNKERCIAIDLGVNNLMTVTNNFNEKSFIINGKVIKSINQHWNKQRAKAMSYIGDRGVSNRVSRLDLKRNNKIHDQMHKASRYIIDYCLKNNVDTIIIGYNEGWKQNANMGKKQNQKFIGIPFLKLVKQIEYKAEEKGISVIKNEESYTSKCDALSMEKIQKHSTYSGKRSKRGLFVSGTGKAINADVNGSLNIMRKVMGDSCVAEMLNKTDTHNLTPIRINVV